MKHIPTIILDHLRDIENRRKKGYTIDEIMIGIEQDDDYHYNLIQNIFFKEER